MDKKEKPTTPIKLDELLKVELASLPIDEKHDKDEIVEVIVKVKKEHYKPSVVKFRAQIDACLFTGTLAAGSLKELQDDPEVVSVALSKKLHGDNKKDGQKEKQE